MFNHTQVMLERQLEHQKWVRLKLRHDAEIGLPPEGWEVAIQFFDR